MILFDVGGVLLHFYHIRDQVAARIGVDAVVLGELLKDLETERSTGAMTEQAVEDLIRERFKLKLPAGFWADLKWVHDFRPIFPMHALVVDLAPVYRLGVLSNVSKEVYEEGRAIPGLWPAVEFNPLILSFRVKLAKPDPKIFEYAVQQAGCKPAEILFIEDVETNIAAAQAVGLQTFLFHPAEVERDVNKLRKLLLADIL